MISLVDKDRFQFTCQREDEGVLHVDIIVTKIDPATTSQHLLRQMPPRPTVPKASEVLYAKELYPLAYKHFEQVGNPVQRVQGEFAWDNYDAVKKKYTELTRRGRRFGRVGQRSRALGRSRTSTMRHEGVTKVTSARDDDLGAASTLRSTWLDKPE